METAGVDLFCGVGGLSYGLKKAGISIVAGVDLDDSCGYAYRENVKADFLSMDITSLKGSELNKNYWADEEKIRILVGCAPCQPFSTHSNKIKNKQASGKWHLIDEFKRIISETLPHIISMENVPNLANQKVFKDFVEFLKTNGYFISYKNVYCPNYGIPQKRRRLVLLASRFADIEIIPETHSAENYVKLKDVIGSLPHIQAGEIDKNDPLHRSRALTLMNLRRMRASKPNGTWLDWEEELKLACHKRETGTSYKSVYGRMSWDEPSSTITTQFFNYGTGRFGHPTQDRALTIREAAILQTFPLDYKFYEDEKDISIEKLGVHIGNAVPVDLGFIIGRSIQLHLEKHNGGKR